MFFRPAQGAIKSAPSHRGAQKRCESARQLAGCPLQFRVGHAHADCAVELAGRGAEAYVMFPPVGGVDDIQDRLLRVCGNGLFQQCAAPPYVTVTFSASPPLLATLTR